MPPPPHGDRALIEQMRQTLELLKRESSEQTQAINILKNGFEMLQYGKSFENKEVLSLIARLTKEVEELTAWRHASYRDMWEGDKSFSARMKDMERDVETQQEENTEILAELREIKTEIHSIRSIDGNIRIERTKGFWTLVVAVGVAFVTSMVSLVQKLVEGIGP